MDRNSAILVAVAIILAIALMNAQLGEDKNPVSGSTNESVNDSVNDTITQRDNSYLQWAEVTSRSMRSHVSDIVNATKINNYSELVTIGVYLKRDAGMSLNQSRYLEVSPGLIPSLEEIQKSLEDYIIVGEYIETAGKNRDDKLMMNASSYARDANDHMTNASVEVRKYMRTQQ